MYTIDTKKSKRYFLVINNFTGFVTKVAKSCNTLENVKKLVGLINIKEII